MEDKEPYGAKDRLTIGTEKKAEDLPLKTLGDYIRIITLEINDSEERIKRKLQG